MAEVLIAYSRDDGAAVARLAGALAHAGFEVGWDDAAPSRQCGEAAADAVAKAKAVVVVWSQSAIPSAEVRADADLALKQKKLVQISIDGRMPPMPFNQLHFVSIADWRGDADHPGWMRIQESLVLLCRGPVPRIADAGPRQPPFPPPDRSALRLGLLAAGALILLGLLAVGAFGMLGN